MRYLLSRCCSAVSVTAFLAGLFLWPSLGAAQEVSGQARAVQATLLGATTVISDTGTLNSADDAREASLLIASIPMLGGAEVPHATTVSSTDVVTSEATLANLNLSVPGNTVTAGFLLARAMAPVEGQGTGRSSIEGLIINGTPVTVTGTPNQIIPLLGGRIVLNEQQVSATGTIVNALHIIVDGIADVVLASASAGVMPDTSTTLPPPISILPGSPSLL